jgi:hypothetical protein
MTVYFLKINRVLSNDVLYVFLVIRFYLVGFLPLRDIYMPPAHVASYQQSTIRAFFSETKEKGSHFATEYVKLVLCFV